MKKFEVTVEVLIRGTETYLIEAASEAEARDLVYHTEDEPIGTDTNTEFLKVHCIAEVKDGGLDT